MLWSVIVNLSGWRPCGVFVLGFRFPAINPIQVHAPDISHFRWDIWGGQ